MKVTKIFPIILLVSIILGMGCNDSVVLNNTVVDQSKTSSDNILIIVGEGGPSGAMFLKAAETFKRTNEKAADEKIYEVHNGDEFVKAVQDFAQEKGKISEMKYFGHGNNVGLYVNQAPNVNGGMYANDPVLNENYLAASFYDLPDYVFEKGGKIQFNGCNVAQGYPEKNTLAQDVANYFRVFVFAPLGPTEFSRSADKVDPIPNANYLDPNFNGDVYMVPTYAEQGFIEIKPQEVLEGKFKDLYKGQKYEDVVYKFADLDLEFEEGYFKPWKVITYGEARKFCEAVFGNKCFVDGNKTTEKIRNLQALKILMDAKGVQVEYSNPWNKAYIWWANQKEILTEDFVNKKWYTRGEMVQLTVGIANVE